MTTLAEELFLQNTWANSRLLEVCGELSDEQLEATASGTYGKIRDILQHIVGAQERYAARLLRQPVSGRLEEQPFIGFEDLKRRSNESGDALLKAATDIPVEPIKADFRGSVFSLDPKVILVQMINHSTEHREQVKAILSHLGVEPPNLDGWTYGATAGLVTEAT